MTAPTDQFVDIARRSQDAFSTVVRTWIDSMQSLTGNVGSGEASVPDVQPYVDGLFDVAERLLSSQREFAHQWVNAAVRAGEAVTEQAARAAKSVSGPAANGTEAGTEAVLDNGAEAVRAAGERAASSARARLVPKG